MQVASFCVKLRGFETPRFGNEIFSRKLEKYTLTHKFLCLFDIVFFYFLLFEKKNTKIYFFIIILLLYYMLNECKNILPFYYSLNFEKIKTNIHFSYS